MARTVVDQGYDSLRTLLAVEEGVNLRQARRLEVRKDLMLPTGTPTHLRHSRGWVAFFCRFVAEATYAELAGVGAAAALLELGVAATLADDVVAEARGARLAVRRAGVAELPPGQTEPARVLHVAVLRTNIDEHSLRLRPLRNEALESLTGQRSACLSSRPLSFRSCAFFASAAAWCTLSVSSIRWNA